MKSPVIPETNFDRVINRRHSESFKWRTYPNDVLPLFVADMDFVSPEPVVRALREAVDHGIFGYPRGLHGGTAGEIPELPQIVADRMLQRYKWRIQPEDIIFLPGVVPAINVTCHAVCVTGDDVLVQPPVYPHILSAPEKARLRRLDAELVIQDNGSFGVDWNQLTSAITEQTRLFLFCNPHNPTGRVFRRDELARLADICVTRNIIICSDEIHSDLLYSGHEHIPIASLSPQVAQQTITLSAPSKTFNLAGLQCAFAIIQNQDLRNRFQKAREGRTPWVNTMGLIAAEAAYREGQPWLNGVLAYLEANRSFLENFVRTEFPTMTMIRPEATYLAWIDCHNTGLNNPYDFFLKQARVALSDGNAFGPGGAGFVRLNFGCPRSLLEEGLNRMKQAMQRRST